MPAWVLCHRCGGRKPRTAERPGPFAPFAFSFLAPHPPARHGQGRRGGPLPSSVRPGSRRASAACSGAWGLGSPWWGARSPAGNAARRDPDWLGWTRRAGSAAGGTICKDKANSGWLKRRGDGRSHGLDQAPPECVAGAAGGRRWGHAPDVRSAPAGRKPQHEVARRVPQSFTKVGRPVQPWWHPCGRRQVTTRSVFVDLRGPS